MINCMNCQSENLSAVALNSFTDLYTCDDCGFSFNDDDYYDMSGDIKLMEWRGRPERKSDGDGGGVDPLDDNQGAHS